MTCVPFRHPPKVKKETQKTFENIDLLPQPLMHKRPASPTRSRGTLLKNEDEGGGLWQDYLDVIEIQRVTWRELCDTPALHDRVIREEDLAWAERQLGWRGAMDK